MAIEQKANTSNTKCIKDLMESILEPKGMKFSKNADNLLKDATLQAIKRNHNHTGPEHIIFALLEQQSSCKKNENVVKANELILKYSNDTDKNKNVEEMIRNDFEMSFPSENTSVEHKPSKNNLNLAETLKNSKQPIIFTEHILAAILSLKESITNDVLAKRISVDDILKEANLTAEKDAGSGSIKHGGIRGEHNHSKNCLEVDNDDHVRHLTGSRHLETFENGNIGPPCASVIPRFAGLGTFARLPTIEQIGDKGFDVAILGVPFDSGCSFRPGARFGPAAIREASRLLRGWNPAVDIKPFEQCQVVDAGDVACNPFSITEAMKQCEDAATDLIMKGGKLMVLGGDHTIAYPMLKAVNKKYGPVALIHFDAHLDTWDTYFGAPLTHGTPFRRASQEGLFLDDSSIHVGIRGPVYGPSDFEQDEELGFKIIHCRDIERMGLETIIKKVIARVGDNPVYISIDIDVLDPAYAPGTGTPEIGGFSSRELLEMVRGLRNCNIVGCDVMEVAPSYDHANCTSHAAASLAYELICLMGLDKEKEAERVAQLAINKEKFYADQKNRINSKRSFPRVDSTLSTRTDISDNTEDEDESMKRSKVTKSSTLSL